MISDLKKRILEYWKGEGLDVLSLLFLLLHSPFSLFFMHTHTCSHTRTIGEGNMPSGNIIIFFFLS